MKTVLNVVCVILLIMLLFKSASNENIYSIEDMEEAIASAEQRGFDRAYAEADYYARMEIEKTLAEERYYAQGEIERAKQEAEGDAYVHGYENGYMAGYDDCLEEHGLSNKNDNVYISTKKKD